MGESSYFIPSEVARLILGYIQSEGYSLTAKTFEKECIYLAEYVSLKKQGRDFPLSVAGLTLTMMLDDYARLKVHDTAIQTGHTNNYLLWKQLESIVEMLKHGASGKKLKSFSQSANQTQSARTRRQITGAKSPQKVCPNVKLPEPTSRLAVHSCGTAKSPSILADHSHVDIVSEDTSIVSNLSVPDIECTESSRRLQTLIAPTSDGKENSKRLLSKNVTGIGNSETKSCTNVTNSVSTNTSNRLQTPTQSSLNPKCLHFSSSDTDILSHRHDTLHARSSSATDYLETSDTRTTKLKDKKTCSNSNSNQGSKEGTSESSSLSVQAWSTLKGDEDNNNNGSREELVSRSDTVKSNHKTVSVDENESTTSDERTSETHLTKAPINTDVSNKADSCSPTTSDSSSKEKRDFGKPDIHETTNVNTCDSWLNGAPGIVGGDKLLAKFGMQQSSSTDSSDHEMIALPPVPVTPSKSGTVPDAGLVTPVKQASDLHSKSPRRKKPKTPRKRLSDIDSNASINPSLMEQQKDEMTQEKLSEAIGPLLHDKKLHQKIAEISTVVLGKKSHNKSHNKSGESHHEVTPEELATITASHSLEEILETESFGHELNLDLSDPVFEGLFKLFGTDKEAFHENLRREKDKTEEMEAEVEELEKSIHEELVACGNFITSQKDEGYETQRAQSNDELYNSPQRSCTSQTAVSEMSSPISQTYTPQHQPIHTSFTSSPCDGRKPSTVALHGQDLRSSPIPPHTPLSSQTDLFSPASHTTHPFSPILTEDCLVNQTLQPSSPNQQSTKAFSPRGSEVFDLHSPSSQNMVSFHSPSYATETPHIVHQNPPDSPDELLSTTNRPSPMPCSPLVKNDIQPGTPRMVQKYSTPFTPQSKHKAVMAAGTVRHLFSPQVYSPGTQKNAHIMIQNNLANGIPAPINEVEVCDSSSKQSLTMTNHSMNYTNFVSGVTSSESRSTPINVRAHSLFHGPELTTIDNAIDCISLPPSTKPTETTPPTKQGKGKKARSGKEKVAQKKGEQNKVQQGAYSTLIGLLSKHVSLPTAVVQPIKTSSALSMPVLTSESDSHTVVLNADENDIHNDTISILSPGGQNYVEVPILHCEEDKSAEPTDIVSEAMTQSDVGDETVCLWTANLNTSTELSVFSPPDSVTSVSGASMRPTVVLTRMDKDYIESGKHSQVKSSKKKLHLETVDSDKVDLVERVATSSRSDGFVCDPGDILTAESVQLKRPQRKVFMKSLNFGPSAGNTVGHMMPSRKVSKGSIKVPLAKSNSSELCTASVNITKDIKYRKIMPRLPGQVSVNLQPSSSENDIISPVVNTDRNFVNSKNCNNDSEIPGGSLSPSKARKVIKKVSEKHIDLATISKNSNTQTRKKESAKTSKVTKQSRTGKELNDKRKKTVLVEKTQEKGKTHEENKLDSETIESNRVISNIEKEIKVPNTDHCVVSKETSDHSAVSNVKLIDNDKVNSKKYSRGKKSGDALTVKDANSIKSNAVSAPELKDGSGKHTRKKSEKSLKVKIVSSKGKKTSDKLGQTPTCKKNKAFTKSPVIDNIDVKSCNEASQSNSEDEKTLKVLKEELAAAEKNRDSADKHVKSTEKNVKSADKNVKSADKNVKSADKMVKSAEKKVKSAEKKVKSAEKKVKSAETNVKSEDKKVKPADKKRNKDVVINTKTDEHTHTETSLYPHTPPKKRVDDSSDVDTPSKEQVLEKLGLTPKKNAQHIRESMQSPSRSNIIDILIQITPKGKEQSPSRQKKTRSVVKRSEQLKSPKNNKTPAKRLFDVSPERKVSSPRKNGQESLKNNGEEPCLKISSPQKHRLEKDCLKKKSENPHFKGSSPGKYGRGEDLLKNKREKPFSKHKSEGQLTVENKVVGVSYSNENAHVLETEDKRKEKKYPGSDNTVKSKEQVSKPGSSPDKRYPTVNSIKGDTKKVTPLRIKDLFKNKKVIDWNKEPKGGVKRPRDLSDRESELEEKQVKPMKKARNSLDLSNLDYEKMMSKLSKIHK